jgi:phosphoribosylformylglycinamidine synthase
MADYCSALHIPVVGGKVSFYNEDSASKRAIKPSPIALVVGLVEDAQHIPSLGFRNEGDSIVIVGETRAELGGSEYHRMVGATGGAVPKVHPDEDKVVYPAVLELIRSGAVDAVHDCSRGGLGVAIAEMCHAGGTGARVDLRRAPGDWKRADEVLFSESHGRFVVSGPESDKVLDVLTAAGIPHAVVGAVGGDACCFKLPRRERVTTLRLDAIERSLEGTIPRLME